MHSQGIRNSVLDLIGETPMVRLSRIAGSGRARLVAKLEWFNPGGSVKDRTGLAIAAKLKGYRLVRTVPGGGADGQRYFAIAGDSGRRAGGQRDPVRCGPLPP